MAVRRGTLCPLCGERKTSSGERPCRKCDRIGSRKPRPCEVCAEVYTPTHSLQRACGRVCGVVLRKMDGSDPWPSSVVTWRQCSVCNAWYTTTGRRRCACKKKRPARSSSAVPTTTTCRNCGELYTTRTRRNGGTCLACQKRLARQRRRAMKVAAFVAPVYRQRIYDRDRWRCRLCGKPVKRGAVVPHPMAPTLDHIIPLAAGGTHEPSNVQCAHFICNSIKSAGGGGEQLLLLG